jgi:hypothetical protein
MFAKSISSINANTFGSEGNSTLATYSRFQSDSILFCSPPNEYGEAPKSKTQNSMRASLFVYRDFKRNPQSRGTSLTKSKTLPVSRKKGNFAVQMSSLLKVVFFAASTCALYTFHRAAFIKDEDIFVFAFRKASVAFFISFLNSSPRH